MPFRIFLISLLLVGGVILVFGQAATRGMQPIQHPRPMALGTLSVPASRVTEAERMLEADFHRRISQTLKEWNRWMEMRREQEQEEHTVDLKAICKERKQLEKVVKMVQALQQHGASPCTRCPDDSKK